MDSSCQHPLGRSVLGVSTSLGAHWAWQASAHRAVPARVLTEDTQAPKCVSVCTQMRKDSPGQEQPRHQPAAPCGAQAPATCQPSSCCPTSHTGPLRAGVHHPLWRELMRATATFSLTRPV